MVALTPDDIWDLEVKFLSSVKRLTDEKLKISINASEAWDLMEKNAFDKKTVFPFLVSELIEDDILKRGDNPDEVIIINRRAKSKRIHLLEVFNDILNHSESEEISIGITLNVRGVTITGLLISLRNYYSKMQVMLSHGDSSNSNAWIPLLDSMKPQVPKDDREWEVISDIIGIGYICLKDAKYIYGSTLIPTDSHGLWIGRVESIDGFMIGTLSPGKVQ